jgi:GT2 family glycosyltransferase
MPDDAPASIVIVNWNGAKVLPRCLEAVRAQTYRDFEVILVDNASNDGSVDSLEERWPGVRLIRLDKNAGFAAANNLGAQQARGRWLALLNNDAFPEPDWLENLIDTACHHPEYAFFACCLVQAEKPDTIDGTGDILHTSGLAWHRDRNQPVNQARQSADEVFSACAAAALYDREAFLQVGGFDPAYFSHHEDVDLGFRLRLSGKRCLYVPDAVVHHIGSASFGFDSDRSIYQMHRNFIWTYVKNMPGCLFWRYLPAHLLANLVFILHYSLRGHGRAILNAKIDALRWLPEMKRVRRQIQQQRSTPPGEIARLLDRGWLSPYLLGRRGRHLRNLS